MTDTRTAAARLTRLLDWTLPDAKSGTVRSWMTERHGKTVDTAQAVVTKDGMMRNEWFAPLRTIDTESQAGAVWFEGKDGFSCRDYAGMRVEAVSEDTLFASTPWGDDARQVIVYRVA